MSTKTTIGRGAVAFQSREDYERWKSGRGTSESASERTAIPEAGDIELRMSAIYGVITLFAGAVFLFLGVVPIGKGGPTFRTLCLVVGPLALLGGILLLRSRKVIVRMTRDTLQIPGAVIPWKDIDRLEREYSRRNFWIHIYLRTPRTDLDGVALKARAMLSAMGKPADYDYTILETDLPRSGIWFIEECQRRMSAGG
jgi:hypothetical protein